MEADFSEINSWIDYHGYVFEKSASFAHSLLNELCHEYPTWWGPSRCRDKIDYV